MKGKVAAMIFVNEKKEILLYLRDNKSSIPYPNFWSLLGGHFEKNETPLQALKREIKEEIAYEIEQNPFFLDIFDDTVGNIAYIYKSYINKKVDELCLTEGQKLGFFSFEEIKKLKVPLPLKNFFIKNKNKIFC